jgi:hypothetical protein
MQFFIVDNAETMKKYWDQVRYLFETLVTMMRHTDEDGISLSFLSGSVEVKQTSDSGKLKTAVRDKRAMPSPGVHTDPSRPLGALFSSYLQGFVRFTTAHHT